MAREGADLHEPADGAYESALSTCMDTVGTIPEPPQLFEGKLSSSAEIAESATEIFLVGVEECLSDEGLTVEVHVRGEVKEIVPADTDPQIQAVVEECVEVAGDMEASFLAAHQSGN